MPLEIIKGSGLAKNKFIRSSPGGGKTTLLRLFTPKIMNLLYARRTDFRELFASLRELGAIADEGVLAAGIYQSCAKTYADIHSIGLPPQASETLFFRLLNARILLSAVEGIQDLVNLPSREEAYALPCSFGNSRTVQHIATTIHTLGALAAWASAEESTVCGILDQFDPSDISHPALTSNKLFSLDLLSSITVKYQDEELKWRLFLMVDDVQWLYQSQRKALLNAIVRERHSVHVWVSERLDALDLAEISHAGDRPSRDFEIAYVEEYWKTPKGKHAFESMLRGVSDRRASAFKDRVIESFSNRLEETLDAKRYNKKFKEIVTALSADIHKRTEGREKYRAWVAAADSNEKTLHEQAIHWASMGILLARDERHPQLEMDFAADAERLDAKIGSDIKVAADLFLSNEHKFPYYYGFSTLAELSTYNVDQFLFIAARLFNEISAIQLMRGEAGLLTTERQEDILLQAVKDWKSSILKMSRHGQDVLRLVDKITKFCVQRTYEPNAPYAPGVTGVALLMGDWEQLCAIGDNVDHEHHRFANALRSALTNNLLTMRLGYECKGNRWALLYLNRALCAAVHLPLHYGGWKEWSLVDFSRTFSDLPGRKAGPKQNVIF